MAFHGLGIATGNLEGRICHDFLSLQALEQTPCAKTNTAEAA
jgi:hypothetical protein